MEKLLSYLKSRWFITLIGVLALILLVWFTGPYFAFADYKPFEPSWVRLLISVVLLLCWGISNIVRLSQSKAKQENLTEAISVDGSSVETLPDTAAVKSRFNEALGILKKSYGKNGNRQYLYELPWYLLIGPPGTGKTTALVNSGLEFPLENHFGKAGFKGVGGTRNCDWWFTNDAVLIDTAGRYTTQDSHAQSDRLEWKNFLELLKKYRKRRPINGVMVAISIDDLVLKPAAVKEQQIAAIRARLQEVIEDLGVNVPVYLLFTKCDLIPGFEDTFALYNKEQRAQVWGMTLSETQQKQGLATELWFETEFDNLIQRIQSQQLGSFYFERDLSRKAKILNFPSQLRQIKSSLREFLGRTFSDSRFHDQFMLRGVYFTSGTQEATSLNRAISQMSNPLGIRVKEMVAQPQQGRSYFLNNLLKKVIIPEADLVGSNRKQEMFYHWLRVTTGVICLVSLVCIGFGLSSSFAQNQLKLNKVHDVVQAVVKESAFIRSGIVPIELIPLFDVENELIAIFSQSPGWYFDLGLYQGNKINEAITSKSSEITTGIFKSALLNQLENQLASQKQTDKMRHSLKTYLMFNDQEHFDADYIVVWFESFWKNKYFDQPEEVSRLTERLTTLLRNFKFSDIDMELVAATRAILSRVPVDQQIFSAIELDANHKFPNGYKFPHRIGSDFFRAFSQNPHQIPKLYTFDGYNSVFKEGLEDAIDELAEDNWVVGTQHGDLTDLDLAEVRSRVEKRYYEQYIEFWEQHLYAVTLNASMNLTETTQLLDSLRSSRSPLRGILEEVSLNTQLSISLVTEEDVQENLQDAQMVARTVDPRAAKLARIARLATKNRFANLPENPSSLVDKRFVDIHRFVEASGSRPPAIDSLFDDLTELQFYIEKILNSGSQQESAYQMVLDRFANGKRDVLTDLKIQARHYPEPINRWVKQLTETVWQQMLAAARQHISSEFQYSVVPIYKATLEKRYPFASKASAEVTLNDFTQFFMKDGVMDLFFKDYLEPFVDVSNSPWRLKSIDGRTIGVNRRYLKQFELADDIKKLFFSNQYEPRFAMSMRPIYLDANVSRFELNIMGQRQIYRHGPAQALNVEWPATILDSSVTYQFEDYYNARNGRNFQGPWSLFRFIDKHPLQNTKFGNRFKVELESKGKKAVYEIVTASANSPLGSKSLQSFKLPYHL